MIQILSVFNYLNGYIFYVNFFNNVHECATSDIYFKLGVENIKGKLMECFKIFRG